MGRAKKMAEGGNFIQKMHMKKGALHQEMGIPKGQKIPAKALEKATHSKNPLLRKRANLAKTLKGLSKNHG